MKRISILDPVSIGYYYELCLYTTDENIYRGEIDMTQIVVTYVIVKEPLPTSNTGITK